MAEVATPFVWTDLHDAAPDSQQVARCDCAEKFLSIFQQALVFVMGQFQNHDFPWNFAPVFGGHLRFDWRCHTEVTQYLGAGALHLHTHDGAKWTLASTAPTSRTYAGLFAKVYCVEEFTKQDFLGQITGHEPRTKTEQPCASPSPLLTGVSRLGLSVPLDWNGSP